jgi:hypothetical protein
MVESTKKRGVFVDRKAGEVVTVNGVEVRLESAGPGKARLLFLASDGDKIDFEKSAPANRLPGKPTSLVFKNSRHSKNSG